MIKAVTNCVNCPFMFLDIDYESDLPFIYSCNLNTNEDLYITNKYKKSIKIPDWCPLKEEPITIYLKQ